MSVSGETGRAPYLRYWMATRRRWSIGHVRSETPIRHRAGPMQLVAPARGANGSHRHPVVRRMRVVRLQPAPPRWAEPIRKSSIDEATYRAGGQWNWRYRLVCWLSYFG